MLLLLLAVLLCSCDFVVTGCWLPVVVALKLDGCIGFIRIIIWEMPSKEDSTIRNFYQANININQTNLDYSPNIRKNSYITSWIFDEF